MSQVGTWAQRRAELRMQLDVAAVQSAVAALENYAVRSDAVARLLRRFLPHNDAARRLGAQLDCALAVLWTSKNVPHNSMVAKLYRDAAPALRKLSAANLTERDFSSLYTLQHGATGTVEVVRCKFDRRLYVLKSILKGVARREPYRCSPVFESQLLAQGSTNGANACTPMLHAAFQGIGSVHLVIEYMPAGDLDSLLRAAAEAGDKYPGKSRHGGLLEEAWAVRYAVDMVAAVGWLHELAFVHRDIKPSNFLLHASGRLKLCDFSTCAPFAEFPHGRRVLAYYAQRPAGTCDYIAPDILLCEERRISAAQSPGAMDVDFAPDAQRPGAYGPALDWWSVGVVLYEMIYGKPPFWAPQPADVYEKIAHHDQHFRLHPAIPCSAPLQSLLRGLICAENVRLGRHGTYQVQQHPAFAHVPWTMLDTLDVPFHPTAPHGQPSVLHSPLAHDMVSFDTSAIDTPPSFSAIYQGALDVFPAFPDSLAVTPPDQHAQHAQQEAPSPVSSAESWPSGSLAAPEAPHDFHEVDVHFHGFGYLPAATAFAPEEGLRTLPAPSASPVPQPLASTPLGKAAASPALDAIPLASPLHNTPESMHPLQRRALQAAMRVRSGAEWITPFRDASPIGAPASPYPFPIASVPRRAGTGAWTPVHTPLLAPPYDTMGSDSRHSGGSTWKRNLTERQAWSEMMDAVQKSARKIGPPTTLCRLAEEDMPPAPGAPSPAKPALRSSMSCYDLRRRMLPLETSYTANAIPNEERAMLRTRRSTRQLLLDAQVTSTPTRSTRAGSTMPSPTNSQLDAPASPPRRRRLRGSASVRDFRDLRAKMEEPSLPVLADASPQNSPERVAPMDSHRTLSEYRRGVPQREKTTESVEDAFGRRTRVQQRGLRGLDRIARRMQSTLGLSGLYQQGKPPNDTHDSPLTRMARGHQHIQRSSLNLV
ncbi:hypothetical protein MVES_001644 [Malassezia vespertilionis]|uniref:non-specific serine/threonine protein kinase n=1 Tax=Malassezia vespertilionis TaxID=2020962 RepID=A0A2N1JD99_9BASI|nr:hypothetical protein MVES_001644 [Malassezia vespertilionis]